MSRKLRLYLIDDEPKLLELLRLSLNPEKYDIDGECHPRNGLKTLLQSPESWDIAIIDHFMPELLGTEVIATLKSQRPDFPVIMATGHAGPDLDRELTNSSYSFFRLVHKPYRRHQLEEIIAELACELGL
jgi:DNA-binding NtrC family response regulator